MTTSPRLIKLFFDLARQLKEMFKHLHTSDSISVLQLQALRFVHLGKQPTMKEVAKYFSITPASATSLMNSLVDAELVSRVTDTVDRRIVKLMLTKKGQETMEEMKSRTEKNIVIFLSKLSSEEQKNLADIFEKLLK